MNELITKNTDFTTIYNKCYRLAAAVFMISGVIDQDEELKTKIKSLSLRLVSGSVSLKDISLVDAKKIIIDLEKNSLELMSMLDIASVSGLISKMNGSILREEFQAFILELNKFFENFENNKNVSVKSMFIENKVVDADIGLGKVKNENQIKFVETYRNQLNDLVVNNKIIGSENGNGHRRKDMRRHTVLEFIKGHNDVSIKDIVPNITGCSEKTIQRELINLINEGKIKKIGERRWSKYSIV